MKHQFLTLCVAVLGLALAQPVMAETSGHDNSDGHHNSQSSESETAMPSAAEAWTTLQNGYEEAVSISDAGKLEEMHVLTDSMSSALKVLQDSAGDNDRLNLALTQVKEVIGDLHVKADGGDAAGTASALKNSRAAWRWSKSICRKKHRTAMSITRNNVMRVWIARRMKA
jgi:hypothetical protein